MQRLKEGLDVGAQARIVAAAFVNERVTIVRAEIGQREKYFFGGIDRAGLPAEAESRRRALMLRRRRAASRADPAAGTAMRGQTPIRS